MFDTSSTVCSDVKIFYYIPSHNNILLCASYLYFFHWKWILFGFHNAISVRAFSALSFFMSIENRWHKCFAKDWTIRVKAPKKNDEKQCIVISTVPGHIIKNIYTFLKNNMENINRDNFRLKVILKALCKTHDQRWVQRQITLFRQNPPTVKPV